MIETHKNTQEAPKEEWLDKNDLFPLGHADIKFFAKTIEVGKVSGDKIHNRGKQYAAMLLYNIFSLAKEEVYIVTNTLAGSVTNYNGYARELEKCLERGVTVRILLEKGIEKDTKTYNMLQKHIGSSNLELRSVNGQTKAYLEDNFKGHVPNFVVTDNSYRVESSKDNYKAIGRLNLPNDNVTIDHLKRHFEEAFRQSSPVSIN